MAKQFSSSSIPLKKTSPVSVRLYRILLQQLQQFPPHKSILLQPALLPSDYGKMKHFEDPTLMKIRDDNDNDDDSSVASHILTTFQRWNKDNFQIQTWFHNLPFVTKPNQFLDQQEEEDTVESKEAHTDTCWATRQELQTAIRYAFQHSPPGVSMQGVAIQAVQVLTEQGNIWACTSTSVDATHGIRIVATSSYLGSEVSRGYHPETKHRFVYRIRVEKLPVVDPLDTNNSISTTVQLLGRTWRIQDHDEQGIPVGPAVVVNASTTGVVGHLPILSSGNVVEYMSGCHLTTMRGKMEGMLHMAVVDDNTPHAYLGDHVEALQPWFSGVKLNVPVASFNLQPPLE